jgi:hypothetical protein
MRGPEHTLGLVSPSCSCPGAAEVLTAELNGQPRPLCSLHDAAQVKARDVDQERADAQAEAAKARGELDSYRDGHEGRALELVRSTVDRGVRERRATADPLALVLGDLVGSPDPGWWGGQAPSADQSIGIGNDAAVINVLAGALGPGTSINDNGGWDDAA